MSEHRRPQHSLVADCHLPLDQVGALLFAPLPELCPPGLALEQLDGLRSLPLFCGHLKLIYDSLTAATLAVNELPPESGERPGVLQLLSADMTWILPELEDQARAAADAFFRFAAHFRVKVWPIPTTAAILRNLQLEFCDSSNFVVLRPAIQADRTRGSR